MITLNGVEIKYGSFPNGETNLSKSFIDNRVSLRMVNNIVFTYEQDGDLIKLMFIKKYLDSIEVKSVHLHIKYMPYSRMDRENESYVFSLKYMTEFINNLSFTRIIVYDPHSDVTPALLNRCRITDMVKNHLAKYLEQIKFNKKKDYLFFPDAGAQKRYADLMGFKTLVGFKERDFETGRIKKMIIVGDYDNNSSKVVILDDLCSKGGTFMLAAEKLKEIGLNEIYMVVGHCEQTVFDGAILNSDSIKEMLTTNSIKREKHIKIKLMEEL